MKSSSKLKRVGAEALRLGVQNLLISAAAYSCGYFFTASLHLPTAQIGGLWAVISGILVIESTRSQTMASAKRRLIGSLIGAILGGAYLYFVSFSVLGYAICVGLGALICHLLRLPEHIKLTGVTISIIMIVSTVSHDVGPITNAGLRFVESFLGTAVAVVIVYIPYIGAPPKSNSV